MTNRKKVLIVDDDVEYAAQNIPSHIKPEHLQADAFYDKGSSLGYLLEKIQAGVAT
ncbi:MAG: hypothetical protein HY514_04435 [Candidatus Aenigmarchaeota archaeon]|nr:hypothetical protein [Candidatus Aenigmarchaeota archaeon]